MEIKGKIIVALPEVSGTSKAGNPWKKREYVLETIETYPKKVHFDFFGDRADQYPLAVGDMITLSFDIESREYMGKWFTSIRGWKAEKDNGQPQQMGAGMQGMNEPPVPGMGYGAPSMNPGPAMPQNGGSFGGGQTDDLPF